MHFRFVRSTFGVMLAGMAGRWARMLGSSTISSEEDAGARVRSMAKALTTILPALCLFWAGACFVWNHFLEGPFLHDAGWYSAIIHRQGLLPNNPPSAYPLAEYFAVHLSVAVSLASALSYLIPLDRVEYYCLFQGMLYAPLGWVAARLLNVDRSTARISDALWVLLGSLLFALNGQVISCLGYPHYEILISVGVCILLLGLALGSPRCSWLGIALAAMTREDGGFHAAAFIAATWLSGASGRPFPVAPRAQLAMLAVSIGASLAAIVLQRVFFQPAGLFQHEYLGEPAFSHISLSTVAERLAAFAESARFVLLPCLGSLVIAVRWRDWRYLLGWAVEFPWFLLNLLAAQELKSTFDIYTGFPFVGSIFWMGAYARVAVPKLAPARALSALAVTSALSAIGMASSHPAASKHILTRVAWPVDIPHRGLRAFAGRLSLDPDAHGNILVDPGIASWAIENMPAERRVFDVADVRRLDSRDGIAFFRSSSRGPMLRRLVAASPFTNCGRIPGTEVFLCARPNRALPPEFVPASLED
jgi:hypothetical protein